MFVLLRSFIVLLGSIFVSTASYAIEDTWHVAIGAGLSILDPDTRGSGLTLVDDQSTAVGINLGLDINPIITTELAFTNLGSASLSAGQSVDYQAISLGAVAYVLGEKEAHFRQDGPSAYVRLGFSSMDNDSSVRLQQSNNTAFWLGAGAQWPINRNWSLRGELTSFDGDANTIMASLVWRNSGKRTPRQTDATQDTAVDQNTRETVADTRSDVEPLVEQPETVVNPEPVVVTEPVLETPQSELADTNVAVNPVPDTDLPAETRITESLENVPDQNDGQESPAAEPVSDAEVSEQTSTAEVDEDVPDQNKAQEKLARRCFSSPMRAEISQSACSVLDGVLAGLDFKPDTPQITLLGKASLDRVAGALKQYPLVVIELQAHTQTFDEEGKADKLSRERIVNVARYLASKGVPIRQLRARSFGSDRPRADNSTAAGRRANNRVELKLL